MSGEEVAAQIVAKGDEIRTLKGDGLGKADLQPHIDALLALKAEYKRVTGEDYKAPGSDASKKKKKKQPPQEQKEPGEVSEKARKKAEKKAEKERQKAAKKAAREKAEAEARAAKQARELEAAANAAHLLGHAPRIQSQALTEKPVTKIATLAPAKVGSEVNLRGYVQMTRAVGPGVFVLLREKGYSVQGVCFAGSHRLGLSLSLSLSPSLAFSNPSPKHKPRLTPRPRLGRGPEAGAEAGRRLAPVSLNPDPQP
mmetsp:Transcript_25767/g.80681  ORF Transcript_25767/g.80681 Transcript_25767/m.80681 type:complete len:255 (-) Transcript_25767:302-1066(-)